MNKENDKQSFEKIFSRLEEILELINSGELGLDDSLKLYEEADALILSCNHRLLNAEKRIEMLIKNRNKELALDEAGKPVTQDFNPDQPPKNSHSSDSEA